MANRIAKDKYFQAAEFLKAEDIKNGQIVTIEKFEEIKTRLGIRPILRLKGFEVPFGLNATNLQHLIDKIGDDTDKWPGKKLTMQKVKANNPQTGKLVDSIRIE
jgi:hypothetical protein